MASMDNLERRHYEQKVVKLDEQISEALEKGERVTMDQLMQKVGLSADFKDKADKRVTEMQQQPGGGSKAFEVQSSMKGRRGTERGDMPP